MQLFKDFPAEGLVRLARLMEVVTHARGDVVVEQGAPLGEICFVRSGQCRASRLVQPPGGARYCPVASAPRGRTSCLCHHGVVRRHQSISPS
jgi:hypothetical protein